MYRLHNNLYCFQAGPVRLFTPYKRRKRKDTSDGEGGTPRKLKPNREQGDSNGDESCDSTGGMAYHIVYHNLDHNKVFI